MKKLWELYVTFLRVGGLTFGGGMAMLPMLKKEVIEKKRLDQRGRAAGYLCHRAMYPGHHRSQHLDLYRL